MIILLFHLKLRYCTDNPSLPLNATAVPVAVIFCAQYLGMSHLPYDHPVANMVIQQNGLVCLADMNTS